MAKFAFLMRDWKEQIDTDRLDTILNEIHAPVRCLDADTGADYYLLVVYTPDIYLDPLEWAELWRSTHEHKIPNSAPEEVSYFDATQDEINQYLSTLTNAKNAEKEAEAQRFREIAQGIERYCTDFPVMIEITKNLSRWEKEQVWAQLADRIGEWPMSRVKLVAQILEVKEIDL